MVKKRVRLTMKLQPRKKRVKEKENISNVEINKEETLLDKLIHILMNENEFNIQIITLMPLNTFTEYLKNQGLKFKIVKHDTELNHKIINIFINEIFLGSKKNILFNNKINFGYIPFYLKQINQEYKEKVLENDKLMKENLLHLTYNEALILMHARKSKFDDICSGVFSYDENFDNHFYILIILNSLLRKGYVKFKRSSYVWNVSKETLLFYANKFDFPKEFIL